MKEQHSIRRWIKFYGSLSRYRVLTLGTYIGNREIRIAATDLLDENKLVSDCRNWDTTKLLIMLWPVLKLKHVKLLQNTGFICPSRHLSLRSD